MARFNSPPPAHGNAPSEMSKRKIRRLVFPFNKGRPRVFCLCQDDCFGCCPLGPRRLLNYSSWNAVLSLLLTCCSLRLTKMVTCMFEIFIILGLVFPLRIKPQVVFFMCQDYFWGGSVTDAATCLNRNTVLPLSLLLLFSAANKVATQCITGIGQQQVCSK